MQLLNNKYKLISQIERNIYNAININTTQKVIIYTYKAIAPSDWNLGKKINEELRKSKLNNEIIDFFYRDDPKTNKKIFYKVNFTQEEIDKLKDSSNNNEIKSTYSTIKPRKNLILIPVCGTCNTPLSLRNMDPTRNKAYCKKCHRERTIFMKEPEHSIKENLEAPRNIDVIIKKDKFLVKMPSKKGKFILLSLLFLISLIPASIIITGGIEMNSILKTLIYIGGIFFSFAVAIPRQYIEINEHFLIVGHKPFGLSATKKINLKKLEQLYVKKIGKRELDADTDYSDKKNYFDKYALKAILKGEKHILLLKTRNPKIASYLEYQIEEYLNIQDKIVPFEYNIDNDLAFYDENE